MNAREKLLALGGDYYDCDEDREQLSHEDPIEALEGHVDTYLRPQMSAEALRDAILEIGDVTVHAFSRLVVPEREIELAADDIIERLEERWADEYGDPDGDHKLDVSKEQRAQFEAAVRVAYGAAEVWRCEETSAITLEPDEVLEIMRAERPDWFEAPSAKGSP